MKTKLLITIGLLIGQLAFAQYIPFPETEARWSMVYDTTYPDYWEDVFPDYGFYHEINGDTLIGGLEYQKLYQSSTTWAVKFFPYMGEYYTQYALYSYNYDNVTTELIGAIRQDTSTKKVYYRQLQENWNLCGEGMEGFTLLNQDVLLFDFYAEEGDTIYLTALNIPYVIQNVSDYAYDDGVPRKHYWYNNYYYGGVGSFVEGMGANEGLFSHLLEPFFEGSYCFLNCYRIEDEYVKGTGFYNCDSIDVVEPPIVAVVELDGTLISINSYPNPFQDYVTIDLLAEDFQSFNDFEIRIYNQLGQVQVREVLIANNSVQINTAGLSDGAYYISVFKNQALLHTERMVKMSRGD